ncbi:hypothetical protein GUJ93_ZPchr0010g9425 [Zizania palustris]|uniref:Uncharacterized protein n=1 Tax=Zizania palustris TaxID=103762 RepID=A0A8J5WI65_ZIZPA|nr:hypothetical protein GUJ93_ZPchr0010g9425 [Zizania palustris]
MVDEATEDEEEAARTRRGISSLAPRGGSLLSHLKLPQHRPELLGLLHGAAVGEQAAAGGEADGGGGGAGGSRGETQSGGRNWRSWVEENM